MGGRDSGGRELCQFQVSDLQKAFTRRYPISRTPNCRLLEDSIHQPRVCGGWVSDCGSACSATYVRHDRNQINLIEGVYMLQGVLGDKGSCPLLVVGLAGVVWE